MNYSKDLDLKPWTEEERRAHGSAAWSLIYRSGPYPPVTASGPIPDPHSPGAIGCPRQELKAPAGLWQGQLAVPVCSRNSLLCSLTDRPSAAARPDPLESDLGTLPASSPDPESKPKPKEMRIKYDNPNELL